ncbi:DUF2845 domain-containing protein [Niveibacterium sp. 24ML]|uniref:DUF2845 domain-containing protein n=1 Tax=Niveibacterium sp. 24ML TaxID=2985512 RepID=UPI0022703220|nr:DUF2845 domain-containing protein [Niveibacterium sp. 24ML]MCX9154677.1 DUF2845 domain-containing protein [Niveibacterium sp. 24ML]
MRSKFLAAMFLSAFVALASAPAAAAFRCEGYVIDVGLKKVEVTKRCGAPMSQETRVIWRTTKVRNPMVVGSTPRTTGAVEQETQVPVTIEEWIYNLGPSQFMQQLTFEDGRLIEIEDLGYGN